MLPDASTHRIDFPAGGTKPYTRLLYREVYEHFVHGKKTLPEGFFKDRIVLIGNSAVSYTHLTLPTSDLV